MLKQRTLRNSIKAVGIGLHTGKNIDMELIPSEANSGINFIRTDLDENLVIPAIAENVGDTSLSTALVKDNVKISTIEHLLSAIAGLGVDNCLVKVNGPEVPIMDGSSKEFVNLIESVPLKNLDKKRKIIKIKKNIKVINDNSSVELKPNKQFSIDFEIDFPSKLISKQSCQLQLINGNYKSDIASARTFGFEKDVDMLRSNGLALGGSLQNAVVVGDHKILNKEGLRFKDEFVRHKILDSIGDLYLAGAPIQGYFYGNKSGHRLNNLLLKSLFSDDNNFEYI